MADFSLDRNPDSIVNRIWQIGLFLLLLALIVILYSEVRTDFTYSGPVVLVTQLKSHR